MCLLVMNYDGVNMALVHSQCSGLEFQVWSTHQIAEGWTGEEDSYLGSAHVDLSALAYGLGQLCGWYHIVDFGQQIRGQLKVGRGGQLKG